eukprot:GHVR01096312.1.p1 GENE.GHVR01096312.1~~GHVR01096312.1.p1  ORF type:complete len:142 (+),score=22.93 GHVR01096312.1:54-428(+)
MSLDVAMLECEQALQLFKCPTLGGRFAVPLTRDQQQSSLRLPGLIRFNERNKILREQHDSIPSKRGHMPLDPVVDVINTVVDVINTVVDLLPVKDRNTTRDSYKAQLNKKKRMIFKTTANYAWS